MSKPFIIPAVLIMFTSCATRSDGSTLLTKATEVAPIVAGQTYLSLLPWVLTLCGLAVFLFGWYTPDPRDNVPCTVIFGTLLALSYATAVHGEQMANVATIGCYVSAVVCIGFYVKGMIHKLKEGSK